MINKDKLNNLHRLSVDDCLLIMHECAERIGLVDVDEYCSITMKGKRATYYNMKQGKIKYFEISGKKYPCVNR